MSDLNIEEDVNGDEIEASADDWIPQQFRRDSLEDSAKAIFKSFKDAQAAFTRVSQERSALEAQLEELNYEDDPADTFIDDAVSNLPPTYADEIAESASSLDANEVAKAVALQTWAALQQSAGMAAGVVPNPQAAAEGVLQEADDLLTASLPNYETNKERIAQEVASNPQLHEALRSAVAVSDSARVASVLSIAHTAAESRANSANLEQLQWKMKVNGQTATGASGRPDPISSEAEAWAAIKNAGTGGYSDVRK